MARAVKLSHLESALETLDYPISREVAADELDDVTLLLADGETNLGELVDELGTAHYSSVDELRDDVQGYLPIEAVGEPGQAEGEG